MFYPLNIIDHFYVADDALKRLLLQHSRQVAVRALSICDRHPELQLDREFIEAAAMLHDIGIIACDAPGIYCHGSQPYICHGTCGAHMLRSLSPDFLGEGIDIERYARVCERHTGAGLSAADIASQHLPLPEKDLLPETLEEQVICYADKFYSKSRPEVEKTLEQATQSP